MKTARIGIIFIFLLVGMLIFAPGVKTVKAGGTIYIRADGSIDPPDASISTLDNVTYTLIGNISSDADGIVVERDNIAIDGLELTIEGMGAGCGVFLYGRNNVTIRNTNIRNYNVGIMLTYCSNNSINANTITNNQLYGIGLHFSFNNSVSENTFTGCGLVADSEHALDSVWNNTVNGKPLVYLEGVEDFSVGDAGQVILVRCNRITVENLTLYHTSIAVQLQKTNNSIISGNNITNNIGGIWLALSSNNRIIENKLANNSEGVRLDSSLDNGISENDITNNVIGVRLDSSSNNSISWNVVTNSDLCGIWLSDASDYNIINGNNITNNGCGISLSSSSSNTVHHNNFVNNPVQADKPIPGYTNSWDNGCEGNYWSNYNGTDVDSDGVGDTNLPCEGIDNYPLLNEYWNPCDISHDLKVDMKDIGTSAKAFGTVPGDTLWNPHADITGPEQLVPDGRVDMRDVSLVARHFGENYP